MSTDPRQTALRAILSRAPVLPVLVVDDDALAVDLAHALVAGGLQVFEFTLRTPVALRAIAAVAANVPDAVVGAGTLLTGDDLRASLDHGARFGVSPGLSPALLDAARASALPLLPGVATASEAMTAAEAGFSTLKLFPAVPVGGVALLQALSGPLPALRFCPTGGVGLDNAASFLALPNVLCVGGSWVAPRAAVAARDWGTVTALARQAAQLRSN